MPLTSEILSYLYECGVSVSLRELVEHVQGLDAQLADTLLQELEEKGLIIRSDKYYRITEEGMRVIREGNAPVTSP